MCVNAPGYANERQIGKCHICEINNLSIGFCNFCCHWFCNACNKALFKRAKAAIKEIVGGPKEGCCGPNKNN